MDKQQEQSAEQILERLRYFGFDSIKVKEILFKGIESGFPNFSLYHEKGYGHELMRYEVAVEHNGEAPGTYQLKEVKATYRRPVQINFGVIDGINTATLDADMAGIDWHGRLEQPDKYPIDYRIPEVFRQLVILFNSKDPKGLEAEQLLIYKHWPPEFYNTFRKKDRAAIGPDYEQIASFGLGPESNFSVDLAYLSMTGRFASLAVDLQKVLNGVLTRTEIEKKLVKELRPFPEQFDFRGHVNRPENYAEFSIPVSIGDDGYTFHSYQVKLTTYPEVPDKIINGIDCRQLEEMMKEVTWKDDRELFIPAEDEDKAPDFKLKIAEIESQLWALSQDLIGGEVADLLRLKFHQEVTFFETMILQSAWDEMLEFPTRQGQFFADLSINKAISLLAGRAVYFPIQEGIGLPENNWTRIDLSANPGDGHYDFQIIKGPSRQDIENMLSMLLVTNSYHLGIQQKLLDGERVKVENELGNTYRVEADPEQKQLKVFSGDGREIPFNFHLDPDYKLPSPMVMDINKAPSVPEVRRQKNRKGPTL